MPLYKTHAKLNILIVLPLVVGVCTYLQKVDNRLLPHFIVAFIYGTLFLGPDLDVADKIKLFSIRGFFTFPFRFYAKVFRHRGISHSIFFGTLTRLAYLSVIVTICCYIVDISYLNSKGILDFTQKYKSPMITIFTGLFLADFFHILLDKFTPKRKIR